MATITSPDTSNVPSNATATAEERMRALIETLSAYIENFHGGSVDLVSFDGAILKIRMSGACLGCPLSPVTLHGWVEGTVRQFFPDLKTVESV
jgi:Fe-S cluster biogenesis protein NfuA